MLPHSVSALFILAAAVAETGAQEQVALEPPVVDLPRGWVASGPAKLGTTIELTFAVRQRHLKELHETLLAVSTPSSLQYGRHLSNSDVHSLIAPLPRHIEMVLSFLRDHGALPKAMSPNHDLITAVVPVEKAEEMLSATYVELKHEPSGMSALRSPGGYSLPARVADAVDFVAPTVHVPGVRRPRQGLWTVPGQNKSRSGSEASSFNTPKNLRKLYSVNAEGKASMNRQGVTAFLEQEYGQRSLNMFWKMFCSGITCGKGEPTLVGDATSGAAGVESMLDIETITGVAGNVESQFWGFKGRSPDNPDNEPFMKWLIEVSKTSDTDVPKIFSTSYGEDEGSWSYKAAQRLNVEFQKAGARGISLLFASGDEGANCKSGRFVPEGPGSSPFVTAVGGTEPAATWPAPGGERAISLSSGGFSNYWPMPDYQKKLVDAYLGQSGLPGTSMGYNTSGRAYPDISAQAANFFVIAGIPQPGVAGTSCASPTSAGVFALLNDLRLQEGKPPLGFLNPFIYENAAAFNDITEGSSSGCVLGKGWPAKQGWDAVTGVGTPNYAALAKVVMALPGLSAGADTIRNVVV